MGSRPSRKPKRTVTQDDTATSNPATTLAGRGTGAACDDLGPAPGDVPALRRWLAERLDLRFSQRPIVAGHHTPLDYLSHVFFQGRDSFIAAPPATSRPTDAPPSPRSRPLDCVVWANRGGGKTFLGAVATALDLIFKPGIEIRILGGSMEQSRRMHAHLRRIFARPDLLPLVRGRMGETRLTLVNGSEVELLAQSHASVRGTRVQTLRCDEVELFKEDVFEAAQLTTRSTHVEVPGVGRVTLEGSVECLSTMHVPFGVMHRLVREALEGRRHLLRWGVLDVLGACADDRSCETCSLFGPRDDASNASPTTDGPPAGVAAAPSECAGRAKLRRPEEGVGHISVSDAIALKRRVSLATWRAEMLCLRPSRTHAVLPEFDPDRHVLSEQRGAELDQLARGTPDDAALDAGMLLAGMDFGYRAPTVVLWAFVAAGVVHVLDERVLEGVLLREHIEAILRGTGGAACHEQADATWARPQWVGVDPAGAAASEQTGRSAIASLREAGLIVRARRSTIRAGLGLIRARLAPADASEPRLLVHPRCRRLIESLERYHYPKDDPESEAPEKDGFDHAVDALRYLIVNLDAGAVASSRPYA